MFLEAVSWLVSFLPFGGDNRDRTDDPLLAKQVLSQLSYTPVFAWVSSLVKVQLADLKN